MNRTSVGSALTATGIGMTLLLAGCGSGGSSATGNSLSPAADADSTTSSPAQTDSSTSSSSSTAASSKAGETSSSATTSPRKSSPEHATAPSGKKSATAMPPNVKPSSKTSPGDKPVALCSVGQLRITVGSGNADMQGSHRPLQFTNVSNKVCKLTGAPGVSFRSASSGGHQVGKPAQRIVGHQPIVLIPNGTASAGLFISSAPRKSDCAKADARGIRVYPPDSYKFAFVALHEVTCTTGGPYLKVGPLQPGSANAGV